ncbi:hypothetical protein SAY86_014070 [Trapa natans]|uniref:Uncharacterized protein n=1 Tax=Trapa natans TaxID=22666 RepID=A0AAN7QR20_TRANT|nr:hypothetical protein SAY86_014070 [Trapa natans]
MEFHANPFRFSLPVLSAFGNFFQRVKEICSSAVSVVLGNIFSAILTFFFALVSNLALVLIDVIASLLSGRLVRERIGPAMLSAVQSQMKEKEIEPEPSSQHGSEIGVTVPFLSGSCLWTGVVPLSHPQ